MSFSSRTKEELCNDKLKQECCRKAALCALSQMAGSLQLAFGGKKRLRIKTESYAVARYAIKLAKGLYALESQVLVRERKRLGKNRSFAIVFSGDAVEDMLLDIGLLTRTEDGLSFETGVPEKLLENDCCKRAFLKGAFMGSGSISNPERGYHLEFVVTREQMAVELSEVLNFYGLKAKSVSRKASYVVYLKESEKITEFLALIGAFGALLELESVKTDKEFNNNLNRKLNCETANIQKTVNAAVRQNENIRYLLNHDSFSSLSPELRAIAELRIDNPEVSLAELGKMLEPPLGKSGVNHRLRKLEEIANTIRQQKGDV